VFENFWAIAALKLQLREGKLVSSADLGLFLELLLAIRAKVVFALTDTLLAKKFFTFLAFCWVKNYFKAD
jgi:hypothetical protein